MLFTDWEVRKGKYFAEVSKPINHDILLSLVQYYLSAITFSWYDNNIHKFE
jgi:hypothetical protein